MYFLSTRGNNEKITASQAIIKGYHLTGDFLFLQNLKI